MSSRLINSTQEKQWIGGLKIIVKRGYHASTSCHYLGLPEFESMAFLFHFLRQNDVFFDVGANIGAYSLLASGLCKATSVAFEPEPSSANLFLENIALNKLEPNIELRPIALGASARVTKLTVGKGIQNHIATSKDTQGIAINMACLDEFGMEKTPILIKLDVEGFETEVINGAAKTLASPTLNAIIIERMGLGQRFGFDEDALHQKLTSFGFQLFDYQPFTRSLSLLDSPIFGNNLYLRSPDFVEGRLRTAPTISIHGICF